MTAKRFELDGPMRVDEVADVRRFVERMNRRLRNADDAARVAMATHELLENAVKFSSDGAASVAIEVGTTHVAITTRNRAREENRAELREIARELSEANDPMVFYLKQMSVRDRVGGLGLGRVAAEAEMKLELVLDGDVVEVRAEAALEPAA